MIHKSGSEAMSVEMKVVTLSIKLEGTNANASQRSFCPSIGAASSAAPACCTICALAADGGRSPLPALPFIADGIGLGVVALRFSTVELPVGVAAKIDPESS